MNIKWKKLSIAMTPEEKRSILKSLIEKEQRNTENDKKKTELIIIYLCYQI